MGEKSDAIVETALVREAAGVFQSKEALEAAIDELLTSGFQRADIDIMGDLEAVYARLNTIFIPVEELADVPEAPRRTLVTRDDQKLTAIGAFQGLFVVGAFATAMTIVASGGTFALALAAAAAAGTLSGALGAAAAAILGKKHSEELETALENGGIVLWVRLHGQQQEERAQKILRKHGATAVRIHEIKVEKRLTDIPLADVQPDPLLERHPIR